MKAPRVHVVIYSDLTPIPLNTFKQVNYISEETAEWNMNKRFKY